MITSCVSQKDGPCLYDQGVKCFHVNVKLAGRLLDDTCIFEKSTVSVTLFPPYATLSTSFGAGHLNAESSIMRARGKPSKRYLPSQHTSIMSQILADDFHPLEIGSFKDRILGLICMYLCHDELKTTTVGHLFAEQFG